jgi:hypothetical protein
MNESKRCCEGQTLFQSQYLPTHCSGKVTGGSPLANACNASQIRLSEKLERETENFFLTEESLDDQGISITERI